MLTELTRNRVYFAGICSMLVAVGVARFSYTLLLPIMQDGTGLTEFGGGWLASTNYMGYMFGIFIASTLNSLKTKYYLHQLYMVLAVISCAAMVTTTDLVYWSVLRFIAGVCASGSMIIASGLILKWLVLNKYHAELGIHFAGCGLSIIAVSVLIDGMISFSADWKQQWMGLSVFATVVALPSMLWMPKPSVKHQAGSTVSDTPPSKLFNRLMLLAYFCAGYGYVVTATFIVDIIEGVESLQGQGNLAFILVGLGATPAVIFADRVARRIGTLKALIWAYGLQIFGILLPAINHSVSVVILSALIFGGTFMACVSLVLTMAGRFFPSNPAKFMGKMALAYGTAQILAPALTGYLADQFGNYDLGLYLSSGVMLVGLIVILFLLKIEKPPIKNKIPDKPKFVSS